MFARAFTLPTLALLAAAAWTPPADAPRASDLDEGRVSAAILPISAHSDGGAGVFTAPTQLGPGDVDRAEIGRSFCFFVYIDQEWNVSGYSGSTHAVETPSGNVNYRCKADLLFGPGVESAERFRGVSFFTFDLGPIEPCDVRITPGDQGIVNCHARR